MVCELRLGLRLEVVSGYGGYLGIGLAQGAIGVGMQFGCWIFFKWKRK